MAVLTIDTLRLVERFEAVGFTYEQAKAQTEALAEVVKQEIGDLVTKRDLQVLETKFDAAIANAKSELVRWVVAVGILQTTVIAALATAFIMRS
ncbi:MAG: DUF1640 domain-containing protein [Solimonas sp.]